MLFRKFILFIFFSFLSVSAYSDVTNPHKHNCEKSATLRDFESSLLNLRSQIKGVELFLSNSTEGDILISSVFGSDFEIENTSKRIASLKTMIEEQQGVSVESYTIRNCLKELKLLSQYKIFTEESKRLQLLKITLLEKNLEHKDVLRLERLSKNQLPEMIQDIEVENLKTIYKKNKLESGLLKNEGAALSEKNSAIRDTISVESDLTRVEIELLDQRIRSNERLQSKIHQFKTTSAKMVAITSQMNTLDSDVMEKKFEELEVIWLALTKENFTYLFNKENILELPLIPLRVSSENTRTLSPVIVKKREELLMLKKQIVREYSTKKNEELKLLNQLIRNSSSLRSVYFSKLSSSYIVSRVFDADFYVLIQNEILSSPHRIISYLLSKYLYIQEQISLGREGVLNLSLIAFNILFIILCFFSVKYFFSQINPIIDRFFHNALARNNKKYFTRKLFAVWRKIRNYSVPLLWLLVLFLIKDLSVTSNFQLGIVVLQVYLSASLLKSLVVFFLGSISKIDATNFSQFKLKAHQTSEKFKKITLFYFYFMLLFEITIGKVYLYSALNVVILIYLIYSLVEESSLWESEFTKYSEKKFSGLIVEKFFGTIKVFPKKLHASFILLFILILLVFDFLIELTEKFEFSKKISANLFKKQIENIEISHDQTNSIPESYSQNFSPMSLDDNSEYVHTINDIEGKVQSEVNEWLYDKSDEHSVVLYGDKGVGKTTLLKKIRTELSLNEELDIQYIKIPPKILDVDSLDDFLLSLFCSQGPKFDIYQLDNTLLKKTVFILDEAQNLFLSKTGGFEAYYRFVNIVNLNTTNTFWVLSFNKYSWMYLDRAFARTKYFRNIIEVKGWNDLKIKELIMKRHSKTPFKLSYDLLISATRSQDEIDKYSSIESKFFKLLWELSNGNPRSALFLWLSALSRKNNYTFNVNIPKESEFESLERLPDELMFVIANVLKHENLTASELEETTNLNEGLVRNSIRIALEKQFLFRDDNRRYMIDISSQYKLIRHLRAKNFIYGN